MHPALSKAEIEQIFAHTPFSTELMIKF
jgi:hypothetical protein